jgi:septal ring factor EnvC (AmiA/AmiB activator)
LVLERTDSQTIVLTTLAAADMLARIRGLQNESPALKDTVAKLDIIVGDIAKARAQRAQLEAESKKIAEDQDRIRRNLQSVGQGSDLGRRYIDTLKTQEDRLAEIDRNNTRIDADIAAKRLAAEDLARRLVL